MIRHYERRIQLAEVMHLAPKSPERQVGAQQVLGRDPPDGQNQLRSHEGDLPHQVREAGGDLLGLRIPVAGRPTLEHIGDEDIRLSTEPDGFEHGVQELPSSAHEGLPAAILLGSRGLPDHEPVRLWIPDAKDPLGAA